MNKKLYVEDLKQNLSFSDMIEKIEDKGNIIIYHYNKKYIEGFTYQYEIFDGIWVVYHNFKLKTQEIFPKEDVGFIEMNYCISGRCESDFDNHKAFYVGPGDFAFTVLTEEVHKHNFPLGIYKGISITTSESKLDNFLRTMFGDTKVNCKILFEKMKRYGKYMILANDIRIQEIMNNFIKADSIFLRENGVVKFLQLILLLINDDIEATQVREQYFDKQFTDKVKGIKNKIIENLEERITIDEIGQRYNISPRGFADCFKQIYGKTYFAFIKEYRIKKAASMLVETNNSIREISTNVGYQNASKFSRAFVDIMGISPSKYRKNNFPTFLEQN